MKITREMVMELNNELAVKGCPFRYEYEGATEITSDEERTSSFVI